jgi:hypothetical protein
MLPSVEIFIYAVSAAFVAGVLIGYLMRAAISNRRRRRLQRAMYRAPSSTGLGGDLGSTSVGRQAARCGLTV